MTRVRPHCRLLGIGLGSLLTAAIGTKAAPAKAAEPGPVVAPEPTHDPDTTSAVPSASMEPDPLAAAHMVGAEAAGAGLYFVSYGLVLSALTPLYGQNGVAPAPGVAIGLAVGGLLNVGAGAIAITAGTRRLRATDAWLDAKSSRRARFSAKARRRRLYIQTQPLDEPTQAVVKQGMRRKLRGLVTLFAGGVMNGVGVAVAPLSPAAGVGLNVAGWSAVVAGSVISAKGKKMMFRPHEHGGTPRAVAVAPALVRGPDGAQRLGISVTGRF